MKITSLLVFLTLMGFSIVGYSYYYPNPCYHDYYGNYICRDRYYPYNYWAPPTIGFFGIFNDRHYRHYDRRWHHWHRWHDRDFHGHHFHHHGKFHDGKSHGHDRGHGKGHDR